MLIMIRLIVRLQTSTAPFLHIAKIIDKQEMIELIDAKNSIYFKF